MPESLDETLTYDSYASVEVLEEGSKVIGWDQRNPVPGGNPGRFKRGIGLAMSQHHAGRVGYRDGERGFEIVRARLQGDFVGGGGGGVPFDARVDLNPDGTILLYFTNPDSGTNHGTPMAALAAEILGFTSLEQFRATWGDSDTAPMGPRWNSGMTTQLQGGAICSAVIKLRQDLLGRAAARLNVDAAGLDIRDGVIFVRANLQSRTTFAELAQTADGLISHRGQCIHPGSIGRA